MSIKDDASNQNTVVTDYNALIGKDKVDLLLGTFSSLLNLPASAVAEKNQMLYVEPAGGSPEIFERGFKYLFFSQQATADKQGKVFAEWIAGLPEASAEDRRLPDARRPVRDPTSRASGRSCTRRHQDRLSRDVLDRHHELRHGRQRDQGARSRTRRPRSRLRRWRRIRPRDAQGRLQARVAVPDHRAASATSTPKAMGPENTEGIFFAISHTPEAKTPGNAEFVKKYDEMFGGRAAGGRGRRLRCRRRCCRPRSRRSESSTTSSRWPIGCAPTGRHHPRPAELERRRQPDGEFLVGQWQDGRSEIVLPEEVATTDKIVPRAGEPGPSEASSRCT